jgi:thiol-disulfide isomerase/thioredoxin
VTAAPGWRRSGGNARTSSGAERVVTAGLVACLAALAVATAAGLTWRARNGRMRAPRQVPVSRGIHTRAVTMDEPSAGPAAGPSARGAGLPVTAAEIGSPLGERATLLQFSSAFCAPCRATRRILADVAGMTAGVAHVEIDAESRLDLVRALGVLRTPTVLVLAADGQIVRRASGQPRKADVIAAIGAAVDEGPDNSYSSGLDAR